MKYAKMIGLAAIAAMALMAFVGAASASAAVEFHTSVGSVSLLGEQEGTHKFTTQGNEVTCTTAKFTGTSPAATTAATQEVHPEYSGCKAFGFAGATVNTAGCQYNFKAATNEVDLKSCTAGKVTVTVNVAFVAKCVVDVPNQSGLTGITYTNQAGKKSLIVDANTNLTSNVVTSTGLCPLSVANGVASNYTGNTKVTANGGAAELFVE